MCGLGGKNVGTVDLGDARRNQRLIDSAARIAATPQRSFDTIFDWNDLRGFDRRGDTPTATGDPLQHTHRPLTRQAMAAHPVVLLRHDTSEIDLTSHTALTDSGPIGDGRGRGFLQHNSLAIVPDTRPVLALWPIGNCGGASRRRRTKPRADANAASGSRCCGPTASRPPVARPPA